MRVDFLAILFAFSYIYSLPMILMDCMPCKFSSWVMSLPNSPCISFVSMVMVTKDKAETFRNQMSAYFAALPNNWQLTLLKPDLEGAVVVTESQEEVE